ncbi:MAG: amino acid permease [Chloroflexi bacterium]|nr:amino acid permease [Chloroflexota bacterium]
MAPRVQARRREHRRDRGRAGAARKRRARAHRGQTRARRPTPRDRGVREAGLVFAGPTYLYVATLLSLVGFGFWRVATGAVPIPATPLETFPAAGTEALTIFLVLKAFSSGSVGLSGTEAVANGVPAFKRPESRNAGIVLIVMGALFGTLFFAVSYLATRIGVQPDLTETQTVLSLLGRSLVGEGPYFYLLQASTAVILILAANTSFSGFPRLASILANDRFMPRQFAQRGERLAFTAGIVALALLAALLVFLYDGSVTGLIPLYTIGVFVAFSLSQAGMVRRWARMRTRGWLASAAINALGAVVTTVVAVIVAVTKFALGAWLVIAVLPLVVIGLYAIHRHYRYMEDRLMVPLGTVAHLVPTRPRVIVPVSRLDRPALLALSIARGLGGDLAAVHISYDEDGAPGAGSAGPRAWGRTSASTPSFHPIVLSSSRCSSTSTPSTQGDPRRPVVVVLAEFVPRHWWEAILDNQTALLMKLRLFVRPNTVVVDVPFHLADGAADAEA